ncbi:MAG: hypothetical protein QXT63_06455 [Thermoplasmata archaeon]
MNVSKLIINADLFEQLIGFASSYPSLEWGGMLIGERRECYSKVCIAIFPSQKRQDRCYCEFDGGELVLIKNALSSENMQSSKWVNIGWIHTHPNLTVFLSGIDKRSFEAWSALDPLAVAVVIDPFSENKKIGAFDSRYEEIRIDILKEVCVSDVRNIDVFCKEVSKEYTKKNWELPTVICPTISDREMLIEIGEMKEYPLKKLSAEEN